MNDGHPRLAVVTGSDHSAAMVIAERACAHHGLEVDVIDLEAACLPDPAPDRPTTVRDQTAAGQARGLAAPGERAIVRDLTAGRARGRAAERVPELVPPAVHDLRPWLAAAEGFVVVAVRTWSLRKAVFWCAEAWRGKPVALVSDPALLIPSAIDRMLLKLLRQEFS
ncbi:hypothetical protein ACIBEJ_20030 [Nonomuraea sp. NPDC050790]|uniref:hypothetical protein n=1 Tax=Nonomuraea sp. NPDC050790 TaxID=3364371 RepID=UPI0037BD0EFD